ncbi:ATP-dependent DNA ligase [Rhizobium sp. BK619]|nr:ATP-dependent DNA ligase [Rhizobium sp. BK619]
MTFDLRYFDGHDITGTDLASRRHLLDGLVPPGGEEAITLSEEIEVDGEHFCALRASMGAKDRNRTYRSGRRLKLKCLQRDGFLIVGYEKATASLGGHREAAACRP